MHLVISEFIINYFNLASIILKLVTDMDLRAKLFVVSNPVLMLTTEANDPVFPSL